MSTITLVIILMSMFFVSAFFSGAEIGMMAINRYRLNHLVKQNHRLAIMVSQLIKKPERLLGVILLGNTLANIVASAVATILADRLFGSWGVIISTFALTFTILVVSEVSPKIIAAAYQQQVAFFTVMPLTFLLKILYPFVWFVNLVAKSLIRLCGIKLSNQRAEHLSNEELRTVVDEAGHLIPSEDRDMLLSIFDLAEITVNDIMIPRSEIIGIDLHEDWKSVRKILQRSQHTRLPLYRDEVDNIVGILHVRSALALMNRDDVSTEALLDVAESAYFVPENTPLSKQLLYFKKNKSRIAIVVDEYGDIQGLITLEDILEEIVGEFTTDVASYHKILDPQADGSYLVDGAVAVRDLNRELNSNFPIDGAKTLSGMIIEQLQFIPLAPLCVKIAGYGIEITKIKDNTIKTARIFPLKENLMFEEK